MRVGAAALGTTLLAGVVAVALARHDGVEYIGTSAVAAAAFTVSAVATFAIGGLTRRADRLIGGLLVAGAWSVAAYLLFLALAGLLQARVGPSPATAVVASVAGVGHVPSLTLFALTGLAARHRLGHVRATRPLVALVLALGLLTFLAWPLVGTVGPPFDDVAGPLAGSAGLLVAASVVNSLWLGLQLVAPVLLWRARRVAANREPAALPRLQAAAVASLVPLCVVTFCALLGLVASGSGSDGLVAAILLLSGLAAAWPLSAAGYSLAVRGPGASTVLPASVLARVGGLLIGLLAAMTALAVVLMLSLGTGVAGPVVVAVVTLAVAAVLRPVGARVHAALVGGAMADRPPAPRTTNGDEGSDSQAAADGTANGHPGRNGHAAAGASANGHPGPNGHAGAVGAANGHAAADDPGPNGHQPAGSATIAAHGHAAAAGRQLERLSSREREVLALLAAGRSNAGIAAELVLSQRTVDAHLRSIFTKLDLPDGQHDNRRVRAALVWAQAARPGKTSV